MNEQLKDMMRHKELAHSYEKRKGMIVESVKTLLKALELDANSEHLQETPERVARMYLNEFCSGYYQDIKKVLKTSFTEKTYDQMVFVDGIEVESLCSHHLVPFFGEAKIGYLPKNRVVGLSKLPRIVEIFANRLQVQERLVEQIASALFETLQPNGVGVYIKAKHLCGCMRGVKNRRLGMTTISLKGSFLEPSVKDEFMALCRKGK